MCLYRGTLGLRHSFTYPYQGQDFLCVKKWFQAQISGILPDCFLIYFERSLCNIILSKPRRSFGQVTLYAKVLVNIK